MSYLKKLLDGCEEASLLAIRHKEEPIPFRKMMEMKIHILFCSCCANFVKQSERIDASFHEFFLRMNEQPPFTASSDFKAMLKEKLK